MRHLDLICSNGIEFWRATVHFAKEGTEDDFPKQDMIALAELWREGCGWLVPDGAAVFFAKKEDGGILDEVPLLVEKRVFAMLQTKPLFPVKINFVLDVLLYCYPVILRENSSLFDSLVHMGNSEATIDYVAHSVGYGQIQADEHILEQRERDREKEENNEEKTPVVNDAMLSDVELLHAALQLGCQYIEENAFNYFSSAWLKYWLENMFVQSSCLRS